MSDPSSESEKTVLLHQEDEDVTDRTTASFPVGAPTRAAFDEKKVLLKPRALQPQSYAEQSGCAPNWTKQGVQCVWNYMCINWVEIINGITVALAQVPEAVAFSFVARVPPYVGLTAAWIMGVVTGFCGGRPGMISGATGAVAAVMIEVAAQHGQTGVFYVALFCGVIQVICGICRLGRFASLIPNSVVMGFCNGLALIIFRSQFSNYKKPSTGRVELGCHRVSGAKASPWDVFSSGNWVDTDVLLYMCGLTILTTGLTLTLPKISKKIPGALTALIIATCVEWGIFRQIGEGTSLVRDFATLSGGVPTPFWFKPEYQADDCPHMDWDLFTSLLPKAIIVAGVGIVDSLMTLQLVDQITKTRG